MHNKLKHRVTHFLLALLVSTNGAAILISSGNAQEQQPNSQCPVITVECPTDCPTADQDVVFRAKITGGGLKIAPGLNWSVFNGKIVSGQGTDALTVRFDDHCEQVTVTVDADGLPPGCARSASCTTITDCCGLAVARKLDEFGDINCEDEMARLDMLAVELENDPGARAYIVFYGGRLYHGRLARRGESDARAGRIKKYLLNNRGIDANRVVMVNGGYRESWAAEVWIAPSGAKAPTPTPTLGNRGMKFRRDKIKKGEYDCGV